jgi:type VI protein secretion system component Hcp
MDESSFDIAMKFVAKGGATVWAESTLQKAPKDPFMGDFDPISSYQDYSNFFEVQSFDFAMNVEPEDAASGNLKRGVGGGHAVGPVALPVHPGTNGASGAKGVAGTKAGDPFQRWRSATEDEARRIKFRLNFDSFRFTRVIDGASPIFFQYCSRQMPFESAAIVKRVATGLTGGTQRLSEAFMRIDFEDVLLKSIKWSDGELVTETCEFVCSTLKFQYRQQKYGGDLGAPISPAVWNRKTDSQRPPTATS